MQCVRFEAMCIVKLFYSCYHSFNLPCMLWHAFLFLLVFCCFLWCWLGFTLSMSTEIEKVAKPFPHSIEINYSRKDKLIVPMYQKTNIFLIPPLLPRPIICREQKQSFRGHTSKCPSTCVDFLSNSMIVLIVIVHRFFVCGCDTIREKNGCGLAA